MFKSLSDAVFNCNVFTLMCKSNCKTISASVALDHSCESSVVQTIQIATSAFGQSCSQKATSLIKQMSCVKLCKGDFPTFGAKFNFQIVLNSSQVAHVQKLLLASNSFHFFFYELMHLSTLLMFSGHGRKCLRNMLRAFTWPHPHFTSTRVEKTKSRSKNVSLDRLEPSGGGSSAMLSPTRQATMDINDNI